jgi:TonB-linked SusC/RagA family outer membrane protein
MRYNFTKTILALLFGLTAKVAIAQVNITGTVKDVKGEALFGVSVYLEKTTRGAVTDLDGTFKIENVKPGNYVLVFSYVGFKTERATIQVVVGKNTVVNKTLKEDEKNLNEMVVVGYGVQRKSEVTGSVSRIGGEKLNDMPAPSFEAQLQGKAAGVQVTVGSGLAGSASVIRIRGIASISAGGDPLYVIDGIPITQDYFINGNSGAMNNNPLASINPDDIESIDILKDAAATAIYGSRGANGVIIVTTKRGKDGGLKMEAGAQVGISLPTARPNMLQSKEYLQLYQEAWENDGNTGLARLPGGVTWEQALKTNTNWVDEMIGVGMKQNYHVSASQTIKKLAYFANVSYNDNGSFLVGNSYQRLSGRLNADYTLNKNIKMGITSSLSRGQNNRVDAAWSGGLGAAMSTALPIYPIYNEDGSWFTGGTNPMRALKLKDWRTVELRALNGAYIEYYARKNLTIRAQASYDYMDLTDYIYEPKALINSTHEGVSKKNPNWISNYNYVLTANYQWKIGLRHTFESLVGNEYQRNIHASQRQEAFNMTRPFYKQKPEAANLNVFSNPEQVYAFLSYFGRVNYRFLDRYFAQVTARVDGSSRFGLNNRYGFFPAVSAGWIISREEFMKSYKAISYAKLRASIGRNGNANLPNYQRFGTYSPAENQIRYAGNPTTYPTRLANDNLRWETSVVTDVSLDMGFFKDRITGELAYYFKRSKDVLAELQVPKSSGFSNYWDNVGQINNSGIELNMNARVIDKPSFKWNLSFNVARNFNKIVSIGVYSEDAVSGGTNDTRVVIGSPVGTNFLVRFSHIEAETGKPVYLDINGNKTYKWDPADRVAVGSVLPKAVGGITNQFTYKGWDVSMMWIYSFGANIYESSAKRQLGVVTDWNMREDLHDRWRKPGDQSEFPVLTQNTATYGSATPWINTTQWLHSGDYLRLRNLTIGYTLPKVWANQIKMNQIRAFVIATNFITITKFPGLDPEIARDFDNSTDRNMSANITYLTPPQEKSFSLGVNLSF